MQITNICICIYNSILTICVFKFAFLKSIDYICTQFTFHYFVMDIVSRLKIFMNSLNISSSQFADACRIARPSLSQLLSGRNKKVSDELIAKIHDAYPQLSISWLLFGEGEMESAPNIQFSEPQNPPTLPFDTPQDINPQQYNGANSGFNSVPKFSSDNFGQPSAPFNSEDFSVEHHPGVQNSNFQASHSPKSIKLDTFPNKRITNIVVFYDDNSFQSFSPS